MMFAYIHCRPTGEPFYVGKGTLSRATSFAPRNAYYSNVVKKHGEVNILIGRLECSDDKTAFELEKGLIKLLTQQGYAITNMTAGGEGFVSGGVPWNKGKKGVSGGWNKGRVCSDETKQKISRSVTEQMKSPERRLINSMAQRGNTYRRGTVLSVETREKISLKNRGVASARKGTHLTGDFLANVRQAAKVSWECPHCKKVGEGRGAASRWHFNNCRSKI
jgi:hypothetical protein